MGARTRIAVLAGKATAGLLRALGRHATTLPGKVALAACPGLLSELSRDMAVVLVTGTNGKTTTTHLIAGMCDGLERRVLTNSGGANMTAGLVAAFVADCGRGGRPQSQVAVLECDEVYVRTAAKALQPRAIVVTNLFRDQLDRWGEVSHIRDVLREGLDAAPRAVAVLNADDSLVASLAAGRKVACVRYFGLGEAFATAEADSRAGEDVGKGVDGSAGKGVGNNAGKGSAVPVPLEGIVCLDCGDAFAFAWRTYGHLGAFRCPTCGFTRPVPDVEAVAPLDADAESATVEVRVDDASHRLHLALPGMFNLYNGLAALACAGVLGMDAAAAATVLAGINSSFGRMEAFACGDTPVRMILVKNPVGLDRALDYLVAADYPRVFFGLNDKTGDGTDISWIWDADLEGFFAGEGAGEGGKPVAQPAKPQVIGVFGTRAEDMALRLKYASADMGRLTLLADGNARHTPTDEYRPVADAIAADTSPVCILANYTAMYDLRTLLGERFGLRSMDVSNAGMHLRFPPER